MTMTIQNYVEGQWRRPAAVEELPVINPATAEELGRTPLSAGAEGEAAAQAAARAFPAWRRVPVGERGQYLFKLKALMEAEVEELSRAITLEGGKKPGGGGGGGGGGEREMGEGVRGRAGRCGGLSRMWRWRARRRR